MLIRELRKFVVYSFVGVLATGMHYIVMAALVSWAGAPEVFATCVGYVSGAFVKYPLNYGMVFDSQQRHSVAVIRFTIGLVVGFFLNALVFALLLRYLNVYYMVSQVLTTGIVLFANYLLARYWIFHTRPAAGEKSAGVEVEEAGAREPPAPQAERD